MSLPPVAAVAVGGAAGAVARYLVSGAVQARLERAWPGAPVPLGTFVVNVVGCLAIGALMGWFERGELSEESRLFWVTGLLGALTTFSTFGHETIELVRVGRYGWAGASVLASVVAGLAAVVLGRALVGAAWRV